MMKRKKRSMKEEKRILRKKKRKMSLKCASTGSIRGDCSHIMSYKAGAIVKVGEQSRGNEG